MIKFSQISKEILLKLMPILLRIIIMILSILMLSKINNLITLILMINIKYKNKIVMVISNLLSPNQIIIDSNLSKILVINSFGVCYRIVIK